MQKYRVTKKNFKKIWKLSSTSYDPYLCDLTELRLD